MFGPLLPDSSSSSTFCFYGIGSVQMMGHSRSRFVIALLLLSVLIAICVAAPPAISLQDLPAEDYPFLEEDVLDLPSDGTDAPIAEKRAVFRMGKRAMMRFGKRAVMRFGKRSVFRLG
ncbi:hypothetical protein L5515_016412 [Caenorhabditis briggsae]|nr:hypothetical protein L5515_016412 [Caenorhabditis briggsae]